MKLPGGTVEERQYLAAVLYLGQIAEAYLAKPANDPARFLRSLFNDQRRKVAYLATLL